MEETPTVSVIIPTCNRRDYVQEAIDSVLAQTYTDYEIIVVDDGCIDGTGEALQARYGDRIRYVWQENQGESVARHHGFNMARACGKRTAENPSTQRAIASEWKTEDSVTGESGNGYAAS